MRISTDHRAVLFLLSAGLLALGFPGVASAGWKFWQKKEKPAQQEQPKPEGHGSGGGVFGGGFAHIPVFTDAAGMARFARMCQQTIGNQATGRLFQEFMNPHTEHPFAKQMREEMKRQQAKRERLFEQMFEESIHGEGWFSWRFDGSRPNGNTAGGTWGHGPEGRAGGNQQQQKDRATGQGAHGHASGNDQQDDRSHRAGGQAPPRRRLFKDKAWARQVLGIDETATHDDAKRAYRQLAHANHPDKPENRTPEHEQRFRDAAEAWDILNQ